MPLLRRLDRGAVAGYGWLSTGTEWIGEVRAEVRPGPGEGYLWNCVTEPRHRRKGVFRSILGGISEIARREGLKRLRIGTVAIPAERALAPAGFRPALRATSVTVAGLQLLWVTETSDRALATDARAVVPMGPGLHLRAIRRKRR